MRIALAVATLAFCLVTGSYAEGPPTVPTALLACAKLKDPGARVRCYDTQVAVITRAGATTTATRRGTSSPPALHLPTAPVATVPTGPSATAAARERELEAQFGAEDLPRAARPPGSEKDVLLSSITAVHALEENTDVISLANGQVWRQAQSSPLALFFRVGDRVRIERGALGSYHLSTGTTGEKNWVQVIRIR